jgi:hypothetical protein
VATATFSTPESRLRQRFVRQWPIAIAGLIATVVLCVATMRLVPPSYSTKASLLLTPPKTSPTATTTGNPNPYMELGGLQPLADVVSRAMMSSSSLTSLSKAGLIGSYTVVRDTTTDGPILTVTTKAKTPEAALTDLRLVLRLTGPQLTSLQADEGVADQDRVTTTVVARDTQASASRKSQIRALVVALVFGLVGTALAVSVVDRLMQRRRAPKGSGRRVRRLTAAPAPGEARAGGARASFSAGIGWRPSLLRSITRNGRARNREANESAASADLAESADSADSDSADSANSPEEPPARARRRPRPGLALDVPEAPPVTARTRRRRMRGNHQQPAPVTAPESRPDARVGSHLP